MHIFLQIVTGGIFLFCHTVQLHSDPVFNHINLSYPGLERVKALVDSHEYDAAKIELLKYFQNRTNRKLPEIEIASDIQQAKENSEYVLTLRNLRKSFNGMIDWTWQDVDKEWNFSLNRMQWLLNFVGAFKRTKDPTYVHAWMDQITSWIEIGQPGFPRTIDTGRRLESWVYSYYLLMQEMKVAAITPEFNAKMLTSIVQQAEFLYYPENWRRFSNWGTFENYGLALVALMFPEFKRSEKWLHEVWFRFRFQLLHSFHHDGMHIEVSPSYHNHELSVLTRFFLYAKYNGINSPLRSQIPLQPVEELISRSAEALIYLYKPNGMLPQVGDTDDSGNLDFLRLLGEYLKRDEFTYVGTLGKQGTPPEYTSKFYPESGYYIFRSGWGNEERPFSDELYLLMTNTTNEPWHAHYDMLSVIMDAYGYELLKDPGRYTYNDDSPERAYFKSTGAHNTVSIDGTDQPRRYTPPPAVWYSNDRMDYVIGRQMSHPRIEHYRSVFFMKPQYWIVTDWLVGGNDNHLYEQIWHLSELAVDNIDINPESNVIHSPYLQIIPIESGVTIDIQDGWISRKYREKTKSNVINISKIGTNGVVLPTILYPYKDDPPSVSTKKILIEDDPGAVAFTLSHGIYTDYYFEQFDHGINQRFEQIETNSRLLFLRIDNDGNMVSYHFIKGTELFIDQQLIVSIQGRNIVVSVDRGVIDIQADGLVGFKIFDMGYTNLFINGEAVEIVRNGGFISYE
jgi:hypothetical protein